jgi:hypothetical protein
VKIRILAWMLTGGLLWAGAAIAEPLDDVRTHLLTLRTEQPVHFTVEVELKHRGAAPLHRNRKKERGKVRVEVDPDKVRLRDQRSVSGFAYLSAWRGADAGIDTSMPLLDEEEARRLADPAGALELLLRDATLLEDKAVTWRKQPARLLVIRPAEITEIQKQAGEPPAEGMVPPYGGELRLWLDESGAPLALEQWTELRLGPVLMVSQHQTLNFQQVGGRLMVADVEETFERTALKVLRGRDTRKMKVKVEPSV